MIDLLARSPEDTRAVAAAIAQLARPGDLVVLVGEMGAGKTAFAQGFARALGVAEPVTSPTYTLVHTYRAGELALHHADLYRLERVSEIEDLGLDEMRDGAVTLVEWGDAADLGPQLRVELGVEDEYERSIRISSDDTRWTPRWERLEAALAPWGAP
jgi:tRNA threonylcarbamoyladenosine biosynthesis protein TsaE